MDRLDFMPTRRHNCNDFDLVPFKSKLSNQSSRKFKYQEAIDLDTTDSPVLLSSFPGEEKRNKQDVMFMYSQIVKKILLDGVHTKDSKQDMIDVCRQFYKDNEVQLRIIDEFNNDNDNENTIKWYTRDCFLYRILNEALRIQNIEVLYGMRYYIKKLDEQISKNHENYSKSSNVKNTLTVYRGFCMSFSEFEKIKKNQLISITSFLSTSKSKEVAYGFARPCSGVPDVAPILLHIEVDVRRCKTPFVDIDLYGVGQMDGEEEVLFTMGTVFRISSLEQNQSDTIWYIHLKLIDDEQDVELKELYDYMEKQIEYLHPLSTLAKLEVRLSNYSTAEKFYLKLLNDKNGLVDNSRDLATVNNNLGTVYKETNQPRKAVALFKTAVDIIVKDFGQNHVSLVPIYNNIGLIYADQRYYDDALKYYDKAVKIFQNSSPTDRNQIHISDCYNNIGRVYESMRRYNEALAEYNRSLQIMVEELPKNHPYFGITYNNIASCYDGLNNFEEAKKYLNLALQIEQNSLRPDHPSISATYRNLCALFYFNDQLEEALDYMKKSYAISSKNFPSDHPEVKQNLKIINEIEQKLQHNS